MPLDCALSPTALRELDAQFRSHLLRLCAVPKAEGIPSTERLDNPDLAFDIVLYTKGVQPGQDWMEASDGESRAIHGGSAAVPLKDADGSSCTVQIASRIEVPFAV